MPCRPAPSSDSAIRIPCRLARSSATPAFPTGSIPDQGRPRMLDHLIGNQKDLEAAVNAGRSRLRLRDGAVMRCDVPGDMTLVVEGPVRADLQFVSTASPTLICSGRARVEVTTSEQSQPRICFSGAADVVAKCHGTSSPVFEAGEYARLRLDSFDESRPLIAATDFASYVLIVHDQAQPRCSGWPSDWQARRS